MDTYFVTLLSLSSLVLVWFVAHVVHGLVSSVSADGAAERPPAGPSAHPLRTH